MSEPLSLGVLVSGRGSNLLALMKAIGQGLVHGQIKVVISNKEDAPALDHARKEKIPTVVLKSSPSLKREEYDQLLVKTLIDHQIDFVILAGFMRLLTPSFIHRFKNKIVNIHPSLLPAFPGLHAQKQALEYGAKVSGCTVHFVDEGCDTGPIILQQAVPILENDTEETLSERILVQEHLLLPKAIDLLAKNKVKIEGRRITIKG